MFRALVYFYYKISYQCGAEIALCKRGQRIYTGTYTKDIKREKNTSNLSTKRKSSPLLWHFAKGLAPKWSLSRAQRVQEMFLHFEPLTLRLTLTPCRDTGTGS